MSREIFKKNDTEKITRPELIEPEFILGVGGVLAKGAIKYSPDNWKSMTDEDVRRYRGALLRHSLASASGEKNDEETGLSHMLHVSANAMFIEWFERNKESI